MDNDQSYFEGTISMDFPTSKLMYVPDQYTASITR